LPTIQRAGDGQGGRDAHPAGLRDRAEVPYPTFAARLARFVHRCWAGPVSTPLQTSAAKERREMEWGTPDNQQALWGAFVQYAQTHCSVLRDIPERAYIVLIPDIGLILDQGSLAGLLRRRGPTPETPIAYVYLDLADYDLRLSALPLPRITDAWVEVFSSRASRRRLERTPVAELV
jgi:hypothetical protein